MGIGISQISFALDTFPGVHRRYEMLHSGDVTVIDEYAHHPSEIGALLEAAARTGKRRLRVVFQPHRFTRSQRLAAKFPEAFAAADEIILADIYSALEKPIEGITTEYLYSFFERAYPPGKVKVILRKEEILTYLKKTLASGDVVLTVGAGDIYLVANALANYLRDKKLPFAGKRPRAPEAAEDESAGLFETRREVDN